MGRIDAPTGELVTPGHVTVGGWVFHKAHPVRQVVVTLDGEPVALAHPGEPRPDVLEAFPKHPSASHAGWTVSVLQPRHRDGEIEVAAYALLDTGQDDDARLGPFFRFAAHTVRGVRSTAELGVITPLTQVSPGYTEVSGTARHDAGLARVEVSVAGGEPVRARHSLPGRVQMSPDPADAPDAGLAGFSSFVRFPSGADLVKVEVSVVGCDGTRAALEPIEVRVLPSPPEPGFAPDRAAVLAERASRQLAALAQAAEGPRRVLVAAHDLRIGGAQLYLHLLVRRLRERGLDLCLVSGAGGPLLAEIESELGIPVLVVGTPPADREQLESQMLQIASFAASHRVVGCLANTLLAFPAVRAVQQLGLPTAWAIHESFEPASFFRQYFGTQLPDSVIEVALAALRESDEVVFEAEATRDLYAPHLPKSNAAVVPYGVDLTGLDAYAASHDRDRVRDELSLPRDARVLLCVGTVEARKGQLALVRAFGRLDADIREGVELVVVGVGSDPYSVALREHVESTGLAGVRLVEVDREVLRWYYAADVLVSASDIESVPRTMLEAMAMGRPVAATDVFGVGELVTDGRTGFTCDPLDLESLTQMLRRVLATGAEELERLGTAARERVRGRHDPEVYTGHYAQRLGQWLAG